MRTRISSCSAAARYNIIVLIEKETRQTPRKTVHFVAIAFYVRVTLNVYKYYTYEYV